MKYLVVNEKKKTKDSVEGLEAYLSYPYLDYKYKHIPGPNLK